MPTDKASNNVAIICIKYYVEVILREIIGDDTYCKADNTADKFMFKVNNRNTRTRCEICSKLTIKTPERRHWRKCR